MSLEWPNICLCGQTRAYPYLDIIIPQTYFFVSQMKLIPCIFDALYAELIMANVDWWTLTYYPLECNSNENAPDY